mgnify:CR=1 FL=1
MGIPSADLASGCNCVIPINSNWCNGNSKCRSQHFTNSINRVDFDEVVSHCRNYEAIAIVIIQELLIET